MANDTNIKSFTAGDIEKYHKGQLSAKEMHAIEKAALDDPFLADALEGYLTPGTDIDADITELKNRLAARTESAKVIPLQTDTDRKRSFIWLRIAVMIVLIAGAGWLTYALLFKPKTNDLATLSQKKESSVPIVKKQSDSVTNTLPQTDKTESLNESVASSNTSGADNGQSTVKEKTTDFKAGIEESKRSKAMSADSAKRNLVLNDDKQEVVSSGKKEENKAPELKALANKDRNPNKEDTITSYVIGSGERKKVVANAYQELAAQAKTKNFGSLDNESKKADDVYRNPNYFRGRVTDANNNALPFANIINTRDNVGTYSDAKGYFALVSPDSVMNVQVKVVGFENRKLNLQNNVATNQVTMQEDKGVATKIVDTSKRNYASRRRDANMTFEEPEPADGWRYYDSYLANNLNIPETLDTKKNEGDDVVEVSFEVNKNGEPVNLKIEKSLCDKCDKEAIRLIKEGPKWKRKAKKGKRTTISVPFNKMD
jgi:CarboxypepD_reg-like domain/Gram-negative bacterial TonB protein C-terminal